MLQTYTEEKRARVRQMWLRAGSDRLKRDVRDSLSGASTAADGVLWRERSDFVRCRSATLGYSPAGLTFKKSFRLSDNVTLQIAKIPLITIDNSQVFGNPRR